MKLLVSATALLDIAGSHEILRRYFVVNGFDGALTMLGLIIGFAVGGSTELPVVINACLGAAIALGVSGFSSAYISETAELKRGLEHLENAMLTDLRDSSHGQAARWVPLLTAVINGGAPLLLSLVIISPMWLSRIGVPLPLSPLAAAGMTALAVVFLLGVFLGRVAGVSWMKSGLQTIVIAIVTVGLIYLFTGG